ncbi:MAG: hypothetical protein ACI36Y_03870, partial [Coriobacteriales bacterium]
MRASRRNAKPALLRRTLACLVSAAMVVAFTPVVAWGGTSSNVTYLDASGNKQVCSSAMEVTESTTSWSAGWYVVKGQIYLSGVTFNGDVHLILADDCILAVTDGIRGAVASGGERGYSLSIYGQESGTGVLTVSDSNITAGTGGWSSLSHGGGGGDITISGGAVTAASISGGDGDSGVNGDGGSVTISGGTVAADSISGGSGGGGNLFVDGGAGGSVTISGGTVTAASISGGDGGDGGDGGGDVTISGGTVAATSVSGGIGFSGGKTGTFNSGQDGDWSGLIFDGDQGKIYGQSFALGADISIPAGKTLTIESGKTLTIAEGKTLTNNGTLVNNGTVENYGSIDKKGELIGAGEIKIAITLHANGGAYSAGFKAPSFYTYGGDPIDLPVAEGLLSSGEPVQGISRGGYTFGGWYEDSSFSKDPVEVVTTDSLTAKNYYAKWTLIAEGIVAEPESLDFGTAEYGYSDFKPITVTIKRNGATEAVELIPPADSSFLVIGALEYASSDSNAIATFTIKPRTGLAPGSYSAAILVSGTETTGGEGAVSRSSDAVTQKPVRTFVLVSFTVEKASPALTITPASSTVGTGEVVELEVSSTVPLPEGAELSLTCTQGTDLYPAEKVNSENIVKIDDGNRFQVVAPSWFGTYSFRAQLKGTDNYSAASAECEISVFPDRIYDLPLDPPAKETTVVVGIGQEVGVAVSGGQATVKEISQELLQSALGTAGGGSGVTGGLVLDLSNTGSTVTSVKMTKKTLESVAGAVNSSESSAGSMSVVTSTGTVKLDGGALSSVASQAAGGDVTVGLSEKPLVELSALQKIAVETASALYGCYEATVTSGGSEVHAFG